MEILKYEKVIQSVLSKLKVDKSQRQDMTQECYIALLEKQEQLTAVNEGEDEAYAQRLCRNKVIDIWRRQQREVRTDSLSNPRTQHKALKVGIPEEGITEEQLQQAIRTLPWDEYNVIFS